MYSSSTCLKDIHIEPRSILRGSNLGLKSWSRYNDKNCHSAWLIKHYVMKEYGRYSWPRHQLVDSDQLHTLAALAPGKEPTIHSRTIQEIDVGPKRTEVLVITMRPVSFQTWLFLHSQRGEGWKSWKTNRVSTADQSSTCVSACGRRHRVTAACCVCVCTEQLGCRWCTAKVRNAIVYVLRLTSNAVSYERQLYTTTQPSFCTVVGVLYLV